MLQMLKSQVAIIVKQQFLVEWTIVVLLYL